MQSIQGFATSYVAGLAGMILPTAAVFGTLVLMEVAHPLPGQSQPSLTSRLKAGVFWLIFLAATPIVLLPVSLLLGKLGIATLLPSLAPPFLPHWLGVVVAAVLAAFVGDLFYYWCHRIQHQVPFLWRFHATHHSVREMSAVTGYHHVAEPLVKVALYGLPLTLLTTDPIAIPVLGFLLGIEGHYLHSVTRLNFGPLGRVFVDNRFHRIHHSRNPEHFDKNYGVFTTLWDRLFGTAYFPAKGEWPEAGLDEQLEPATIREFLTQPFQARKATSRRAAMADQGIE